MTLLVRVLLLLPLHLALRAVQQAHTAAPGAIMTLWTCKYFISTIDHTCGGTGHSHHYEIAHSIGCAPARRSRGSRWLL